MILILQIFQDLKSKQPKTTLDYEEHDIYLNMVEIVDEARQRGNIYWFFSITSGLTTMCRGPIIKSYIRGPFEILGTQNVGDCFYFHFCYSRVVQPRNNFPGGFGSSLDESEAGEDGLLVSEVQISSIDPISKMEMVDPCKSKNCGHTFEKSSILTLLKNKIEIRLEIFPRWACLLHYKHLDIFSKNYF